MTRSRKLATAAAVAVPVLIVGVLVTSHVSSSSHSPAGSASKPWGDVAAGAGAPQLGAASGATDLAGRAPAPSDPAAVDLSAPPRSVVRTAALQVTADHLSAAQTRADTIVSSLGGYVADENSQADRNGVVQSVQLVLKVPSARFDTALRQIAALGTVHAQTESARDVTSQVVDVRSRVASARTALRRIRALLGRANTLGSVIQLEGVLSDRQSNLEALLAQQKSLAAQTQLGTLTVDLTKPSATVTPPAAHDSRGFVAGLRDGWGSLQDAFVAVSTAVGAGLPFAVLLLLVGLLGWALSKRLPQRLRGPRRPITPSS
ncbi:MAG: DUF4349 domain-containing protein [Nocardioidaceae bacterium]